jgi:hypothetical protein
VNEVTRERSQSFLTDEHIDRVVRAYRSFKDETGFTRVATLDQIRAQNYSLAMALFVESPNGTGESTAKSDGGLRPALRAWLDSRSQVTSALTRVLPDFRMPDVEVPSIAKSLSSVQKNRAGWKRVRFGDVVKMMKETVDPSSGELDRYIAGEHMDSEDVHLRRWGTVGDGYLGPAFIRRFKRGQVLYGSRRTYLKKVAYAEFDGITANTTFVLEAVPDKLHQPLLPWLMLSDRFTEHSVRESKGSTNPYINFPDIAKFEFDLPPLDQQQRIARILCSLDVLTTASLRLCELLNGLREATVEEALRGTSRSGSSKTNWPLRPVREIRISRIR